MASDDELAQTATAPSPRVSVKLPRGDTLGRFRLENKLGEGGMGVVHAAFDPELERRVALKVLRHASSEDARGRLLREARAMAKLSHPNVIVVFDVGSADGEDFVAMELIDGETLGEWIGRARPRRRETIAAFIAAGRGLAAAHAEGLVHRDFKPNNVLRSRLGRIVVTDFGLARVSDESSQPLPEIEPAGAGAVTRTVTGALVGTPAYMAPEQWTGAGATAATDQFAFCVALWEALAGERPYRGATLDEIKTAVLAGPAALESDAIPRALRAILRRGLATDPAHRWPSMDELLAQLDRIAGRRRRVIVPIASVATLAGVAALVLAARRAPAAECSPPALDPAAVWSSTRAATLALLAPDAAGFVGADLATWSRLRPGACQATPAVRSARLACLDGVLERIDATVASALRDRGRIDADSVAAVLVDPALCDRDAPPRLAAMTPELGQAFGLLRQAIVGPPPPALATFVDHTSTPCAHAVAILARLEDGHELGAKFSTGYYRDTVTVTEIGEQCSDDAIKAMVAAHAADGSDPVRTEKAEAAISVFPQDELRGDLERIKAGRALRAERWDEGWSLLERALELYGRRHRTRAQLAAVTAELELLIGHGRPEDLARIDPLVARWRPTAVALGPRYAGDLDAIVASLRWHRGDVAGADADYRRLHTNHELPDGEELLPQLSGQLAGEVVDEAGAPVAGATVAIGFPLASDSEELGSPIWGFGTRETQTDASGHFSISGADGWLAAQAGALRSSVTKSVPNPRLVLHPTGHVEGSVELGTTPAHLTWIVARTDETTPHLLVAPVLPTGRFSLDRVPLGTLAIGAVSFPTIELGTAPRHIVVGREPVTGVVLTVSKDQLFVVARSADVTRPDAAMIWVIPARPPLAHPTLNAIAKAGFPTTPTMAIAADLQHLPAALEGHVTADDLTATISARPAGELVVCALGFAKKQLANTSSLSAFGLAMSRLDLGCAHVAPDQTVVTVEVPPLRKIEPEK